RAAPAGPARGPGRARALPAGALREILFPAAGLPGRAAGPGAHLHRLHEQLPQVREADRAAARGAYMSAPAFRDIGAWHDGATKQAGTRSLGAFWTAIEDNHRNNCLLWDEEDLARRRNVADAEIAGNKRAIDGYNQKRNDAMERIDEQAIAALPP